jgi:aldose 1-epimerase
MSVARSGRQLDIAFADQRATIVEVGGALRTYGLVSDTGVRHRLDGYEADEMCSGSRGQVLMPWPNRIAGGVYEFAGATQQLGLNELPRNNAIHGLVRYANWDVATHEPDRVVVTTTLFPQPGYPFLVGFEIEYSLAATGLTVRATATNLGPEPCPYGAGFHPYLRLDPDHIDGLELQSPAATHYRSDDRMIPIGRAPVAGTDFDFRTPRVIAGTQMDTAFTDLERGTDGRATVTLRDPATRATVALWCDESYGYLMIFTGDALPDAHRRRTGLAVEPMTAAPNAFRSGDGLLVLDPGASSSGSWGISATA